MTAARKPQKLPTLAHGDGSIWWDDKRRKVTLSHRVNGKSYFERADTVAEALAARDARRQSVAEAVVRDEALNGRGDLTFAELAAEWLRYDVKGAPKTVIAYRDSARRLTTHLGRRYVADLKVAEIERLFATLTDELGTWSLRKLRSHLVMILAFAKRREYITHNPATDAALPANMAPPREHRWLDRDEFTSMRAHLALEHSTLNAALLFCLLTGARPGEVLGLRWSAVDLDAGTAHIRSALQWKARGGPGEANRHDVVDELKTKTAYRTVELPADLVTALRRERADQRQRRIAAPRWRDLGLAFTTRTGTALDPGHLRRGLTVAAQALGIAPIAPKDLRHSLLSALVDARMPLPAVARQAGHRDMRMVATTYGHALDDVVPTREILDRPRTVSG